MLKTVRYTSLFFVFLTTLFANGARESSVASKGVTRVTTRAGMAEADPLLLAGLPIPKPGQTDPPAFDGLPIPKPGQTDPPTVAGLPIPKPGQTDPPVIAGLPIPKPGQTDPPVV